MRISPRMTWCSQSISARRWAPLSAKQASGAGARSSSDLRKYIDLLAHAWGIAADRGAQQRDPDFVTDREPVRALQRIPYPGQLLQRHRTEYDRQLLDRGREAVGELSAGENRIVVQPAHRMTEHLMGADGVLRVRREQIIEVERKRRIFLNPGGRRQPLLVLRMRILQDVVEKQIELPEIRVAAGRQRRRRLLRNSEAVKERDQALRYLADDVGVAERHDMPSVTRVRFPRRRAPAPRSPARESNSGNGR